MPSHADEVTSVPQCLQAKPRIRVKVIAVQVLPNANVQPGLAPGCGSTVIARRTRPVGRLIRMVRL